MLIVKNVKKHQNRITQPINHIKRHQIRNPDFFPHILEIVQNWILIFLEKKLKTLLPNPSFWKILKPSAQNVLAMKIICHSGKSVSANTQKDVAFWGSGDFKILQKFTNSTQVGFQRGSWYRNASLYYRKGSFYQGLECGINN